MGKINKYIEIVRSNDLSLSSMSMVSCLTILDVLSKFYEHVGITTVNNTDDLELLISKKPDLVFLGIKKVPLSNNLNHEVWLSEYFDNNNQSYTGSPSYAIALDFDKSKAKEVVQAAGLKTSSFFIANKNQFDDKDVLPIDFPLFLKPTSTGGGTGIDADSVVRDFPSFDKKVNAISNELGSLTLVEEYLSGREFSVAIFETLNSNEIIAMPIELITAKNNQGDRVFGREVKAINTEQVVIVDDISLKQKIVRLAIEAFKAIGARDYGRIDIRLDSYGTPHFLEANLIPSLISGYGNFPKACMLNTGLDYESMILNIAELGMNRNSKTISHKLEPVIA